MSEAPQQPPAPRTEEEQIEFLQRQVEELRLSSDKREHDREDEERSLRIKEIKQRMQFQQLMLFVAVSVIVLMGLLAYAGTCVVMAGSKIGTWQFSFLTVPSAYAIALFVAPIASISIVTVALMFGTFRRFKDSDADTLAGAALDAGKTAAGQSVGV